MSSELFDPQGRWVAVDLETTGLDPQADSIIEIGAVRFDGGLPVDSFCALVNPGCPLPPQIAALTGLTDSDLDLQPYIDEVLVGFAAFVGDDPIVGHNLHFDLGFLSQAGWERAPTHAACFGFDTLELSRFLLPGQRSHSLGVLLELSALAAPNRQRHRAHADAEHAGRLLGWLFGQGVDYPRATVRAALAWLAPAAEQFPAAMAFLSAVLAAQQATSPANGRGTAAVRPPRRDRRAHHPGNGADAVKRGELAGLMQAVFAPGGLLAGVLEDFEIRPEQAQMSQSILKTMRQGGALAVEAGTGIGKSLAYLAPALALAEETNEKVVVSTNTVTLQDQLAERDLPLLAKALARDVNFVVLKGRSNYLCRRKWHQFLASALTADPVERLFGLRTVFWQSRTETGDQGDLNLLGREEAAWQLVNGDEGCWGTNCPEAGECYVNRARRRAQEADLIIANHALVCANLATGGRLLPEFAHLVLDEAHHFATVATDHLGLTAHQGELAAIVGAAAGRSSRGMRGLALTSGGGKWPKPADLGELAGRSQLAQAALRTLFSELGTAFGRRSGGQTRDGDGLSAEVRYGPGMAGLPSGSKDAGVEAAQRLRALANKLGSIAEGAPDNTAAIEVAQLARSLSMHAAALDTLCEATETDWVYWLEDSFGGPSLRGVPVQVGGTLRERLWTGMRSTILVSATLSVMDRFDHVLSQLGLTGTEDHDDPPASLLLHSPFDYRHQALLCVPTDLPLPAGSNDNSFAGACAAFLGDLLPAVGGRSLVLFTSHRMLRQTHSLLAADLANRGLTLYAQGIDGDRSRLLRALRSEERVVVFGSATFWEGIDVRGPQLSCLVIAKLPFPRPDEPIVAARQERLEQEGKAAFAHYSLPQAVLRLRQGFGRLIRSTQDRGAVVILDARVLKRHYGRAFLTSLPETSRCFGRSDQVVARVTDWLANPPAATGRSGVSWTGPMTGVDRPK